MSLESQIDELYRRPLDDFTKARNALAKTLAGSPRTTVASLVKPSVAMWAINQLYFEDRPTYKALIDASEKLRAAHKSMLSGRKVDTRAPDELHRATIEKAYAKTLDLAEHKGVRLTDPVRESIRRTLAALPGDEPPGRLTRPPEPAGFSLLTGIKARALPAPVKGRATAKTEKPSKDELRRQKEALRAQKREEQERLRAERKAQKEKERREGEIRKAEQALREAERRLAELKRS